MRLTFNSAGIFDLYGLHEKLTAANIAGYSGVSVDYGDLFVELPLVDDLDADTVARIEALVRSHSGKKSWDLCRKKRAVLFADVDWRIQRAEDNGQDTTEMRAYRQALRDVTNQSDPDNVTWPVAPWRTV